MNKHIPAFLYKTLFLAYLVALSSCSEQSKSTPAKNNSNSRLLVFTKTEGFRHASIPEGVEAIQQLAAENNWTVHHSEDASIFSSDSLDSYRAVIFLNTTGDILDDTQQSAFEAYMGEGGGFVGIHAATDTEYEWPWYGKMVGAYFESHPEVQEATLRVIDKGHPSTTSLPNDWIRTDEWYNFKNISPDIRVLITLDESTYEGGSNGENHPAAWYHEYEGGKVFYTAGGHTAESYNSEPFLNHVLGGIRYAVNGISKSSQ